MIPRPTSAENNYFQQQLLEEWVFFTAGNSCLADWVVSVYKIIPAVNSCWYGTKNSRGNNFLRELFHRFGLSGSLHLRGCTRPDQRLVKWTNGKFGLVEGYNMLYSVLVAHHRYKWGYNTENHDINGQFMPFWPQCCHCRNFVTKGLKLRILASLAPKLLILLSETGL